MQLGSRIFEQTSLNVLSQVVKLVLSTITNIIVINALPRDQFGVVGVMAGYFLFISWLTVTPEDVLLQRFQKVKQESFGHYISFVYSFGTLRLIVITLISALVAPVILALTDSPFMAAVFILYTAIQMIILQSGAVQFILKIDFQQRIVTIWTLVHRIIMMTLLIILLFHSNVLTYFILLLVDSIIELIGWTVILQRHQLFKFWIPIRTLLAEAKTIIWQFSLWQHGIQRVTKYMYEVDTLFLSFWASLTVVGNYAIAVKIANLSFILPMIVQQSVILALTQQTTPELRHRSVTIFIRYCFLISMVQLVGFLLIGKWYIYLHTRDSIPEIFTYTLFVLIGASIINVLRPFLAMVTTTLDVKRFFIQSLLPAALFTTIAYSYSAYQYGAFGIAVANILCYSFWALTILIFIYRHSSYRWTWIGIAPEEKKIIRKIAQRLRLVKQ